MLIFLPRPCIWEKRGSRSRDKPGKDQCRDGIYALQRSMFLCERVVAIEAQNVACQWQCMVHVELKAASDEVDGGQSLASKSAASSRAISLANHVACKSKRACTVT